MRLQKKKGNQRKTTGSYYTPDSLVQALLNSTLDPVLNKIDRESNDPRKDLLELSVIDPACGSGHFLLGAARRIATRLAKTQTEVTPSLAEYRQALRDTARHCIFGVDINPMAVELTKVALWIETVNPGHPLGYFDAQIRCGDSLVGLLALESINDGIPDDAYKPLPNDDNLISQYYKKANNIAKKTGQGLLDFEKGRDSMVQVKPMEEDFSDFRSMPEDNLDQINSKAERFRKFRKSPNFKRAKTAADLYIAAFILPKTGDEPIEPSRRVVPTSEEMWHACTEDNIPQAMKEAAEAARQASAFHWSLEFPDIMSGGGFDVVLGNPPWDQIEIDPDAFFANSAPEVTKGRNKAAKDKIIENLKVSAPNLYTSFEKYRSKIWALQKFIHTSGRFPTSSFGRLNTSSLFVELCIYLSTPKGHAGLIVPIAIATGSFNKKLFNRLISERLLSNLIGFENREAIFPAVHRDYKFCILNLSRKMENPEFSFFLRNNSHISDRRRNFSLSPESISLLNPNTRTAPVFRSCADAELVDKVYRRVPMLQNETCTHSEDRWRVSFQLMFMMNSASGLFCIASELAGLGFRLCGQDWVLHRDDIEINRYVPLYEGKLIWNYDHRAASYGSRGDNRGYQVLPETKLKEHENPLFEPAPFYWIPYSCVADRQAKHQWDKDYFLGWRDVTSAMTERTMIAAMLPKVGASDTLPIVYCNDSVENYACLLSNFNSLPFDYIARQKISNNHLRLNVIKQFPILTPSFYTNNRLEFIVPKVLELTYTSTSLTPFARDLGYSGLPFGWDEDRRDHLRADLDAFYARAYGFSRDELRYILDPSEVHGHDYPSETFRVLMEGEIKKYNEYRTRRLILSAWDRMESHGEFTAMGM